MSLAFEIRRRRQAIPIEPEPVCDGCGHGASLHTLHGLPCVGCRERGAAGGLPRAACIGFASDSFDNSRNRRSRVAV